MVPPAPRPTNLIKKPTIKPGKSPRGLGFWGFSRRTPLGVFVVKEAPTKKVIKVRVQNLASKRGSGIFELKQTLSTRWQLGSKITDPGKENAVMSTFNFYFLVKNTKDV